MVFSPEQQKQQITAIIPTIDILITVYITYLFYDDIEKSIYIMIILLTVSSTPIQVVRDLYHKTVVTSDPFIMTPCDVIM